MKFPFEGIGNRLDINLQLWGQAAEVALLTRNILITGVPDSNDALIGGHFVVYQTSVEQRISDVEFTRMGQQGRLGRCSPSPRPFSQPKHSIICSAPYIKLDIQHTR